MFHLYSSSFVRALLVALTLSSGTLVLSGCGSGPTIPGTEIPDTPDNRAVINTLERYRIAFVSRDAAGVLSTAHPTYYDTAGTDDPSDDITYEELAPILRRRMAQLESVRFTIDYLEVHTNKDRAVVKVWIDASFRLSQITEDEKVPQLPSRHVRMQDHNMFELAREGDTWLITSGL